MKLAVAFSILGAFRDAFRIAFPPTFQEIRKQPGLLWPTQWRTISALFMSYLWLVWGAGVDGNAKKDKERLLQPLDEDIRPKGVVLDIGAGYGLTAKYLDRSRVSHYVALEPNIFMHAHLREIAKDVGFQESDGSLIILSCGAEDTGSIVSILSSHGIPASTPPVNTIISILSLCSIPDPQKTLAKLVQDLLKPGGTFFTMEHVLHHREDVAWWQQFWAPFWSIVFDGCRMDRPSDLYMKSVEVRKEDGTKESVWKGWRSWITGNEVDEALFWHHLGWYVKK
ncbi:S-adenosyl-L-methionine-dependent methyltransferase [Crepidotus variabilis]|uniref:S-adenosyl-L-methionine-dependent methyltransferase n=1 Tax=Crepidotus variabilis TaxID=179855 RepID=A0A9P6EJL2_9AGAR|nr:S-adenosyl-L-methionine-dependent methyltransferase [Crepidotus variabilis]